MSRKHEPRPFAICCEDVYSREDLGDSAIRVYLVLLKSANEGRACWPSIGTIGEKAGNKKKTAVRIAIRELERAGLLIVSPRFCSDGRQSSNEYIVLGTHAKRQVHGQPQHSTTPQAEVRALDPSANRAETLRQSEPKKEPSKEPKEGEASACSPDSSKGSKLLEVFELSKAFVGGNCLDQTRALQELFQDYEWVGWSRLTTEAKLCRDHYGAKHRGAANLPVAKTFRQWLMKIDDELSAKARSPSSLPVVSVVDPSPTKLQPDMTAKEFAQFRERARNKLLGPEMSEGGKVEAGPKKMKDQ